MSNTDKLLRAFIKAQGYEIEELKSFDMDQYFKDSDIVMKGGGTKSAMPQQKDYAIIDYKVTKKSSQSKFEETLRESSRVHCKGVELWMSNRGFGNSIIGEMKQSEIIGENHG